MNAHASLSSHDGKDGPIILEVKGKGLSSKQKASVDSLNADGRVWATSSANELELVFTTADDAESASGWIAWVAAVAYNTTETFPDAVKERSPCGDEEAREYKQSCPGHGLDGKIGWLWVLIGVFGGVLLLAGCGVFWWLFVKIGREEWREGEQTPAEDKEATKIVVEL